MRDTYDDFLLSSGGSEVDRNIFRREELLKLSKALERDVRRYAGGLGQEEGVRYGNQ